jgi:hypothetical protein
MDGYAHLVLTAEIHIYCMYLQLVLEPSDLLWISGTIDAHPVVVRAHSEAMETHPGAMKVHPGVWRFILLPWKLILEP